MYEVFANIIRCKCNTGNRKNDLIIKKGELAKSIFSYLFRVNKYHFFKDVILV